MTHINKVKEKFGSLILGTHDFRGDETVVVHRDSMHEVLRGLKENPELDFNILMDLTAVDYQTYPSLSPLSQGGEPASLASSAKPDGPVGGGKGEGKGEGDKGSRFEVVYHLYSLEKNHRLRVKVPVEENDCVVPTATDLWAAADWFEREAWDMFGIRFDGHPHLKRILMYEEFVGHPLRKDYPVNKRQPLIGPQH